MTTLQFRHHQLLPNVLFLWIISVWCVWRCLILSDVDIIILDIQPEHVCELRTEFELTKNIRTELELNQKFGSVRFDRNTRRNAYLTTNCQLCRQNSDTTNSGYYNRLPLQVKPYLSKDPFVQFSVTLTHLQNGSLRNTFSKVKKNYTVHTTGILILQDEQPYCEVLKFQFISIKFEKGAVGAPVGLVIL